MKKALIIIGIVVASVLIFLFSLGLLAGIASPKVLGSVKQSRINAAKANQQIVQMTIVSQYIANSKLPNDEEINATLPKSLSELKISVIRNVDGTISIRNTNTELSKEEVPDLLIGKKELGI